MFIGLLGLLGLVAGLFAALCALLYWKQDSLIFMPQRNDPLLLHQHQQNRIEIATPDGMLEAWWIENPQATSPIVILYFGGNAEDVLHTATTASRFNAQRMLVANYRGYGRSTGTPGQKALYEDALAIYEHVISMGVKPEQIVVMGRSLGSGVATMLAGRRPVRAALLITPFDSLAAVAAKHYPVVPVQLLLRHPFPSSEWAKEARVPALFLGAKDDVVIPPSHAQRLYEAWSGSKQIHVLPRVGHNDIELHPDYYRLINAFLATQPTT